MSAAALDPSHPTHPVATTVASVRRELRSVAETPVWSLTPAEAGVALVEVTRLQAQVAQLQLRLLAQHRPEREDSLHQTNVRSNVTVAWRRGRST